MANPSEDFDDKMRMALQEALINFDSPSDGTSPRAMGGAIDIISNSINHAISHSSVPSSSSSGHGGGSSSSSSSSSAAMHKQLITSFKPSKAAHSSSHMNSNIGSSSSGSSSSSSSSSSKLGGGGGSSSSHKAGGMSGINIPDIHSRKKVKKEENVNEEEDDDDDDDDDDDLAGALAASIGGVLKPEGGATDAANDDANREQDRFLPVANIARLMKKVLPGNAKVAKDAKEVIQNCVSEFISFITSEASDKCQVERRKTISGDDLLWAMSTLGFENYIEPLRIYLYKFREAVKQEKPEKVISEKKASKMLKDKKPKPEKRKIDEVGSNNPFPFPYRPDIGAPYFAQINKLPPTSYTGGSSSSYSSSVNPSPSQPMPQSIPITMPPMMPPVSMAASITPALPPNMTASMLPPNIPPNLPHK